MPWGEERKGGQEGRGWARLGGKGQITHSRFGEDFMRNNLCEDPGIAFHSLPLPPRKPGPHSCVSIPPRSNSPESKLSGIRPQAWLLVRRRPPRGSC